MGEIIFHSFAFTAFQFSSRKSDQNSCNLYRRFIQRFPSYNFLSSCPSNKWFLVRHPFLKHLIMLLLLFSEWKQWCFPCSLENSPEISKFTYVWDQNSIRLVGSFWCVCRLCIPLVLSNWWFKITSLGKRGVKMLMNFQFDVTLAMEWLL